MTTITAEPMDSMDSNITICKHCHRKVTHPGLVGISLICSYCMKPVNG